MPSLWFSMVLAAVLFVVVGALYTNPKLIIDDAGLRLKPYGLTWFKLTIDDVNYAGIDRDVQPLADFGGYSWRVGLDGRRGMVVKNGPALVVDTLTGPQLVVTLPLADAEHAVGLLNGMVDRAGATAGASGDR